MTETSEVMDRYLDALRNGRDFAQSFAPDVVWTTMETGVQIRGREAVREHIVAMHTRSFDAHPELVSLLTGEGAAMLEAVFIGRQVDTWEGVPASGRDVRFPYAMAYDIAGGFITALRAYFPMAALRAQLVRAEAPGSAPAPV
ncbi:nuclear transport factor 2 family protein [Geodermatophilus sp. SYSU D00525]